MRIVIAVGELLHQLVNGWQFTSYQAYSPEVFPQYTFGQYFWLNFGLVLGMAPVVVGTILHVLFRRTGKSALLWSMQAAYLLGALLLVTTAVIRAAHGWDVWVLGLCCGRWGWSPCFTSSVTRSHPKRGARVSRRRFRPAIL